MPSSGGSSPLIEVVYDEVGPSLLSPIEDGAFEDGVHRRGGLCEVVNKFAEVVNKSDKPHQLLPITEFHKILDRLDICC